MSGRDISLHQVYASGHKGQPTVVPRDNFDAEAAAKGLKEAMDGVGTDEFSIVMILGTCTSEQRQEVRAAYKAHFGKDLIDEFASELSGEFGTLARFCLYNWDELFANLLFDAMDGAGTKEGTILQVLCPLSGPEIELVKEAYAKLMAQKGKDSSHTLEADIESELSGDLRQLIVAVLQGQREVVDPEDMKEYMRGNKKLKEIIDAEKATQDAEDLYNAGEGKWGTDESTFVSTFVNRSKFSLWATNELYKEKYGTDLIDAVKSETSGKFQKGLTLLFLCQLDPKAAYVKLLKDAMDGLGTSDKKLMTVIVDRSEIDLKDIMERFEEETGQPLIERIASETSGDYKKLLTLLCGGTVE